MKKKIKLAVLTVARSDLSIMVNIIKKLEKDKRFDLHLIIGGAHKSEIFGRTINDLNKLKVKKKIQINSNYTNRNSKNINLAFADIVKNFGKIGSNEKLDGAIIMGDRYEMLASAIACYNNSIPIFHFCGGSITEGSKDNTYRYIVSKLACAHFVETSEHKKNLVNENIKKNIFIVGAPALEGINKFKRRIFLKKIKKKKLILSCFHPETTETLKKNKLNLKILLNFVASKNENIIFTYPNADEGYTEYIKLINKKLKKKKNVFLKKNLGSNLYYEAMSKSDIMIGNSSSGIIESASFHLPTINLGNRQKNRFAPKNVYHCKFNTKLLNQLYNKLINKKKVYQKAKFANPYFKKNTAKKSIDIIFNIFKEKLIR